MQIPARRSRRDEKWKARNRRESEIERPIALANPIPNSSSFARPNHVSDAAQPWKNNSNFFPLLNYLGDSDRTKPHDSCRMLIILKKCRLGDNIVSNIVSGYIDRCAHSIFTHPKLPFSDVSTWNGIRESEKVKYWCRKVRRNRYLPKVETIVPFRRTHCRIKSFCVRRGTTGGRAMRSSVCFYSPDSPSGSPSLWFWHVAPFPRRFTQMKALFRRIDKINRVVHDNADNFVTIHTRPASTYARINTQLAGNAREKWTKSVGLRRISSSNND